MMVAITIMMVAAAICISVFIVVSPKLTPVLSGQRWIMPGLGDILIVKTIGMGGSFGKTFGKHIDVKYQLTDGEYGYCTKSEIRSTGRLLPYNRTQRDIHIQKILNASAQRSQEKKWQPYTPPSGWVPPRHTHNDETVYDAEIINPAPKKKSTSNPGLATFEDLD